jgi:hemerythrin
VGKDWITWGPELELGIPEIDAQHKALVDLANRLHCELMTDKSGQQTRRAIAELFAYSATHFADEEAYFARFNLPGIEDHAATHASFVARAVEFEERLVSSAPADNAELLRFLQAWIRRHIARDDRELLRIARRTSPHP